MNIYKQQSTQYDIMCKYVLLKKVFDAEQKEKIQVQSGRHQYVPVNHIIYGIDTIEKVHKEEKQQENNAILEAKIIGIKLKNSSIINFIEKFFKKEEENVNIIKKEGKIAQRKTLQYRTEWAAKRFGFAANTKKKKLNKKLSQRSDTSSDVSVEQIDKEMIKSMVSNIRRNKQNKLDDRKQQKIQKLSNKKQLKVLSDSQQNEEFQKEKKKMQEKVLKLLQKETQEEEQRNRQQEEQITKKSAPKQSKTKSKGKTAKRNKTKTKQASLKKLQIIKQADNLEEMSNRKQIQNERNGQTSSNKKTLRNSLQKIKKSQILSFFNKKIDTSDEPEQERVFKIRNQEQPILQMSQDESINSGNHHDSPITYFQNLAPNSYQLNSNPTLKQSNKCRPPPSKSILNKIIKPNSSLSQKDKQKSFEYSPQYQQQLIKQLSISHSSQNQSKHQIQKQSEQKNSFSAQPNKKINENQTTELKSNSTNALNNKSKKNVKNKPPKNNTTLDQFFKKI